MSGILAGLFERRFHPSQDPPAWATSLSGYQAASGANVTPDNALSCMAVFGAVHLLAETVASLPLLIYRRIAAEGKERASDHPLYNLLHLQPNPEMTSFEWRETLMGHLGIRGNAYNEIEYDRGGRILGLWPLRPDKMKLKRAESGQLIYEYRLPANIASEPVLFLPEQVLHLRWFSTNGLVGMTPIGVAMQAIGLAMAAEEFGARYFGNGSKPGVVLEHPGKISDPAYERLKTSWEERHQGLERSHRVAILEEGMKIESIGIAPEEAQFLETRKFQVAEIARLYRVPPHLLADLDRATFSNIEHQAIEFVVHTIRPWLVRWEQRMMVSLLTPAERINNFIEFLVDGLLRGDTATRYQAYATARQNGWLSANDIRRLENMNPVEGGDMYLVPLNMIPADQVGSFGSQVDQPPTQTNDGLREYSHEGLREYSLTDGQRSAGHEHQTLSARAMRSASTRHRLQKAYKRIYRDTAARILRREANDVRKAAEKFLTRRDYAQFSDWLNGFYREHSRFVIRQMTPVAQAYGELVAQEAADEVAGSVGPEFERFTQSYVGGYAARHTGISADRIRKRLQAAQDNGQDELEALDEELDGWEEGRADGIANEESVRFGNAASRLIYILAGVLALRSVAFGENCPYCDELDGTVVGIHQWFIAAGDSVEPDGQPPLTSTTDIGHPPYHDGCDCMIVAA